MNGKMIRRIYRVTTLITFASLVFYLFFQINKREPFRDINPFAEDPYDAVGSFAIQGALLVGILTYARSLRLLDDPAQATKTRLILRGNSLILSAIWITLFADTSAEIVRTLPPSDWGIILRLELGLMFLFTLICTVVLVVVFRPIQTVTPPNDLTPADGIDDLWTLARVPVMKARQGLPRRLVEWVQRFNSDRLFARAQWLNPRTHAWRFACILGLLVGVGLALAQLQEGLPPNLKIGFLVLGIFISAEFGATLLGFALLGGYLGLRPSFNRYK